MTFDLNIKLLKRHNSKLKAIWMYVLLSAIAFVMLFPLLWLDQYIAQIASRKHLSISPATVTQPADVPKLCYRLAK
jgi:ABC-type glycerol-3-phosphate transport system permease component